MVLSICCKCKKVKGFSVLAEAFKIVVTHGYCDLCFKKEMRKLGLNPDKDFPIESLEKRIHSN